MRVELALTTLAIAYLLCGEAAPRDPTVQLARDPKKPFVYIEFDHSGARPPQTPNEPLRGLWLRLTNNSTLPIVVRIHSSLDDPNMTILDDVVTPQSRTIINSGDLSFGPMPNGYASAAHVSSSQAIAPGKSVLFSVPVNHVSPGWFLQVPFQFELPPVEHGANQPVCYVPFTWDDIPEEARKSEYLPTSPKAPTL